MLLRAAHAPRTGRRGLRANISVVALSDTSLSAQAVLTKTLRALSGEQRLLLAFEMSLVTREMAKAVIRRDHPDWPETQISRELLRRAFLPASLPPSLR